MAKNDGGKYSYCWTVRDEFAAKAMQGMLSEDAESYTFESCAQVSYRMADAMLKEREK